MKNLIVVMLLLVCAAASAQTDTAQMKRFPNDRATDSLIIKDKPLLMDSVRQPNQQTTPRSNTDVEQNYQQNNPQMNPKTSSATPAATPAQGVQTGQSAQPTSHRNGVMMKNGKMIVIEDGLAKPMSQSTLMTNGSQVMMDGTVTRKDGTKTRLKDGDFMDHSGNVTYYREPLNPKNSAMPDEKPKDADKAREIDKSKSIDKWKEMDKSKEIDRTKDTKKDMYLVPDSTLKKSQPK